ncbi:response regulator transcription factor [Anabaena cylindrica FACHB-243]|uniref:Two component transcriptional regulator, winged helix family n=1 Tax=Anabaena cylindrica (strain ATCC 27899 / PCC 7122) TaxID=272123 RepID=K9ZIZ1_ANACC|nr:MULTISPECIES: two-component system response regulator RppA [Anabaena]AFZ58310.1 two component transcriptional regulator, winged helix family [Anabaena cylindrica PCC 7122]MBD2416902.1 response regulator transcription factor [Anabaena cylindrica FACHB-243]MBY5281913.1 response regulator transcription factor [Anabaena sp. CCAP 1446/1C]MBY5308611.1 response regulator transcription factor [Anabaena sp. CCAP 1446/1C]MCM2406434.1 response regulator transcription factor [Anabaena sp. CCAP 1446/1C]
MRLLLVEDEKDLGISIYNSLKLLHYIVDWIEDGETAWDYLNKVPPRYEIAILDWMLPKLSGLELCQRLRAQKNQLPIMLLTARDSMSDRVTGLDAGADDYLVKPFGMEELLARVRALQRRLPNFQPPQLQIGSLMLDYGNFSVVNFEDENSPPIILTAKEFQLLEYFMQHPEQILTHEQIRARLWDFESDTVSNVVAAQVRLLRRKLSECGFPKAIETIRGFGYRFCR